uniref:Jacalin-type lectin domain-containing protein n=1 Tax=Heterorhabditis bacteriophora TaxID=37862 RepID=A0A1I7WKL6_HETBA
MTQFQLISLNLYSLFIYHLKYDHDIEYRICAINFTIICKNKSLNYLLGCICTRYSCGQTGFFLEIFKYLCICKSIHFELTKVDVLNERIYSGREHVGDRLCGTDLPLNIKTMQPVVHVQFVTTAHGGQHQGYNIKSYTLISIIGYKINISAAIREPPSYVPNEEKEFAAECGGTTLPGQLTGKEKMVRNYIN